MFIKALAFWKALCFIVAGVLAMLAYFGLIPGGWAFSVDAVLAFILGILKLFDIVPELRSRGLLK